MLFNQTLGSIIKIMDPDMNIAYAGNKIPASLQDFNRLGLGPLTCLSYASFFVPLFRHVFFRCWVLSPQIIARRSLNRVPASVAFGVMLHVMALIVLFTHVNFVITLWWQKRSPMHSSSKKISRETWTEDTILEIK